MAHAFMTYVVQSVLTAYIQFVLPMISWLKKQLECHIYLSNTSNPNTMGKNSNLNIRRLYMPCMQGGVNILNIRFHVWAQKSTILDDSATQK